MRNSVPPKPELGFLHPTEFGKEVDDDKDNKEAEEAEEEENYDQYQITFEEFERNEAGSLSFMVYDEGEKEKEGGKDEDKEPVDDRLWEPDFRRIDSLRMDRREAILKEEIRKYVELKEDRSAKNGKN